VQKLRYAVKGKLLFIMQIVHKVQKKENKKVWTLAIAPLT